MMTKLLLRRLQLLVAAVKMIPMLIPCVWLRLRNV